jgi:AcrR family transcriptional regulator
MSTTISRAAQKQATRQAIVEAAAWFFARRGIEATSIDAIAARVGLTKGAVYANFENKRELIEAVAEAYSAPADFRWLLRRDLPLAERLRLFGRSVADIFSSVSVERIHLDFEYQVYAKRNRLWATKVRASLRRHLIGLAIEFDAVNRERGETPPLPAEEFFDAILALGRGIAHQLAIDPDAMSPRTVETLFALLAPSSESSRPT